MSRDLELTEMGCLEDRERWRALSRVIGNCETSNRYSSNHDMSNRELRNGE